MKKILILFTLATGAISAAPERLVTVGAMASELICDLGRCGDIVAVDVTSVYPRDLLQKPKVGYVSKLSAEGILSMKPTALIYIDGAGPAQVLQQLEQSGVRLVKLNKDLGNKAAQDRILELGKALKEETKAKALAAKVGAALDKLAKEKPAAKRPKVLFLYARGAQTLLAMGKNTTADEFIALAGGENAFTSEGYKPINAEAVAASQADIILIPEGSLQGLGGKDALKSIPGLGQTPAGKRLAVVTIDDSLLAGLGPRTAAAVKTIRKKITEEMARGK